MVRIATVQDAEQLEILNNEFNGEGETTLDNIRASLADNKQEIVVVDELNGKLTGFVCVQLKKSFCYDEYMPEITEVYVKPQHRRCGVARTKNTVKAIIRFINLNYLPVRRTMLPGLHTPSWDIVKMPSCIWLNDL